MQSVINELQASARNLRMKTTTVRRLLPTCILNTKLKQLTCFMPELPDITVYLEALETRILGRKLERTQIGSPFLLRTTLPIEAAEGKTVAELRRLGKRICIGLEDELWLVLHLMIAGRLHWKDTVPGRPPGKSSAKAV